MLLLKHACNSRYCKDVVVWSKDHPVINNIVLMIGLDDNIHLVVKPKSIGLVDNLHQVVKPQGKRLVDDLHLIVKP